MHYKKSVDRWEIFELALEGPEEGNPFLDVELTGIFKNGNRKVPVRGFYDGGGVYRVRFMPDMIGEWSFTTDANVNELDGHSGSFECTAPGADNHGPVRIRDTFHFVYADSTPHFSVGTTCYVWNHQGDAREEQTLKTLASAPFNKIRMCVFPKWYPFNHREPALYPFAGDPPDRWDYSRFNPAFFRHLETRIRQLLDLGIEADIILFHPYDKGQWGFDRMDSEVDDRYLRYVVARLAAFRNVWWSFANEYDLMEHKTTADWDRFFKIVQSEDHVQHLRGIHNCREFYDHGKPWVTHCSVQHHGLDTVKAWREQYRKPVVVDECGYEGNIQYNWGNLTPQSMVDRFWIGTVLGGYVGHGETYLHPEDILWWSHGNVLTGESHLRIAFLRRLLEEDAAAGRFSYITPLGSHWNTRLTGGEEGRYYLWYFSDRQPGLKEIGLPESGEFAVDVIDCWEMTVTPVDGVHSGTMTVKLPSKPLMAIRAYRKA
jgi:hypothetical protein